MIYIKDGSLQKPLTQKASKKKMVLWMVGHWPKSSIIGPCFKINLDYMADEKMKNTASKGNVRKATRHIRIQS